MDISVVFWEFLVIAFIFTATIIASEFVRRWLEKIEKDDIQSETETSNLVFEEIFSCDPHFLVVEETDESVPMDSSSLGLFVECADKGPNKPITSLEECIRIRDDVDEGSEKLKDAAMMTLVCHFGPEKAKTITLEELKSIESKSSTLSDEDDDNIIKEIEE